MMITPAFANQAAPCPPLADFTFSYMSDEYGPNYGWFARYAGTAGKSIPPLDYGVIITAGKTKKEGKAYADAAVFGSIVSGDAKLVNAGPNQRFWACISTWGNYSLTTGVVDIFFSSGVFVEGGEISETQPSRQEMFEKYMQLK